MSWALNVVTTLTHFCSDVCVKECNTNSKSKLKCVYWALSCSTFYTLLLEFICDLCIVNHLYVCTVHEYITCEHYWISVGIWCVHPLVCLFFMSIFFGRMYQMSTKIRKCSVVLLPAVETKPYFILDLDVNKYLLVLGQQSDTNTYCRQSQCCFFSYN